MPHQKHLEMLQKGVSAWNTWRQAHPEVLPDLRDADLTNRELNGVNFKRANLTGAKLCKAVLDSSSLSYANLTDANMTEAKVWQAELVGTLFNRTIVHKMNCGQSHMCQTLLLNMDMQTVIGLNEVRHSGPSMLDVATLIRFQKPVPEKFLTGAGVPRVLLDFVRQQGKAPFVYHSCFISYASEDQHFVDILQRDLQREGVRCWFAPVSLQPGDKFPERIADAIQRYDTLLLILSKHALRSGWVKKEVELARQKEGSRKQQVLVPVRLDASIINNPGWANFIKDKRHIANFEHWKHPSIYQKEFQGLLFALRKHVLS